MPCTFHDFTNEIGRLIRFPGLTGPIWRDIGGRFNQVLLYSKVAVVRDGPAAAQALICLPIAVGLKRVTVVGYEAQRHPRETCALFAIYRWSLAGSSI
jgi:hypothetical protein